MVSDRETRMESVRENDFPGKPSRRGALFLFDDAGVAKAATENWWPGREAFIVRARDFVGSRIHRGHLGCLEEPAENWDAAFRTYWAGERGDNPPDHWEYIVDGRLYFPDWNKPPFGLMAL
jgi:hypothetical protein